VKVKPLYTPAEISRLMGIARSTVHDWVNSGALTTVKIGGKRLVPLAALKTHGLVWDSIRIAEQARAHAS
jgi:excisionase family DNA binding protein